MKMQKTIFMEGEAHAWFKRNKSKLGKNSDPVTQAIEAYKLDPSIVLEVGCSNGWRLELLKKKFDCEAFGIEPMGNPLHPNIIRRTADNLGVRSIFDVVIYGWCLYLADPDDYFKIAAEGDRVLVDGGFLIVYDFYSPFPHRIPYKHKEGLFSYHYDFSKLWLSHPAYTVYGRTIQDETCVTILKKRVETAFPEER